MSRVLGPLLILIVAFYLLVFRVPQLKVMVENSNALLFPIILLVGMIITSLIIIIKEFIKEKVNLKFKKVNEKTKKFIFNIFFTFSYIFMIKIFGFFLITPVYLILITYFFGSKKYLVNFIYSIIITAIIYFLFIKVLYVPLPAGVWIFKDFNEIFLL